MVAVGNLRSIWTIAPDEIEDFTDLQNRFGQYFGRSWEDVMVGGNRPYSYYRDWDAYLAVEGMKENGSLMLLPDLSKDLITEKKEIYQTIIG